MKRILSLLSAAILFIGCDDYTLSNDDYNTLLVNTNGKLTIQLSENEGDAIIAPSPINIAIDDKEATWTLLGNQKVYCNKTLPMLYGEFSEVTVPYNDMVCDVKLSTPDKSIKGTLTVRLFDNAFAYQLQLKNVPEVTKIHELSSWIPAEQDGDCFATNGEHEPVGGLPIKEMSRMSKTPLIYQGNDYILAFHECDLMNYPQLVIQGQKDEETLAIKVDPITTAYDVTLPWRTVMVGEDFKDLHNQKPIYQTMSREADGDFSWVKPGLCMWDWRVKGTTFNGFTYEMTTESLKRYIDFCSKSNISYFLIDDEWFDKNTPLVPVEGLDLKRVIEYGNSKNVGIILYYDMKYVDDDTPAIDFETVAATYAKLGVAGMKYGFLSDKISQRKTVRTYDIIKTAAKYKLLVDFHDAPIPFSGLERTFPNYINREYCHAQLDRRTAFNPRQFVKMACINLLAGHMDQTNGTFALNEMATRSKGPRNAYPSTVSAEVARFIFTHTGSLSVLIDAPEAYEEKSDLFEIISK